MFVWADLLTRDPDAAAQFYRGLAGYSVERWRMSNVESIVLVSGRFTRAGISHLPPSVERPGWLPFVQVDDVLGTIGRAVIAGGKVVLSPRPELLDGQVAVIADPRGGIVGVVNASGRKAGQ
jgi:predicted enzyme related to lactoylglutathione lyase